MTSPMITRHVATKIWARFLWDHFWGKQVELGTCAYVNDIRNLSIQQYSISLAILLVHLRVAGYLPHMVVKALCYGPGFPWLCLGWLWVSRQTLQWSICQVLVMDYLQQFHGHLQAGQNMEFSLLYRKCLIFGGNIILTSTVHHFKRWTQTSYFDFPQICSNFR